MSFDEDVPVVAVIPSWGHPHRVRMGRHFPAALFPDVRIAVPTMVATDPDVIPAGRGTAVLDHCFRWSNFDNDVSSVSRADSDGDSEQGVKIVLRIDASSDERLIVMRAQSCIPR